MRIASIFERKNILPNTSTKFFQDSAPFLLPNSSATDDCPECMEFTSFYTLLAGQLSRAHKEHISKNHYISDFIIWVLLIVISNCNLSNIVQQWCEMSRCWYISEFSTFKTILNIIFWYYTNNSMPKAKTFLAPCTNSGLNISKTSAYSPTYSSIALYKLTEEVLI